MTARKDFETVVEEVKNLPKGIIILPSSKEKYTSNKSMLDCYCPTHKAYFTSNANSLISRKRGCHQCGKEALAKNLNKGRAARSIEMLRRNITKATEAFQRKYTPKQRAEFLKKGQLNSLMKRAHDTSSLIHFYKKKHPEAFEKLDFSKFKYVDSRTPATLICKEHGPFTIQPHSLLKSDCPCIVCRIGKGQSKVERAVTEFLEAHDINFKREVHFKGLVSPRGRKLHCDFYLPDLKVVIECDGPQHREYSALYHQQNPKELEIIMTNDRIVDNFFKHKKVKLYRIQYRSKPTIRLIIDNLSKILKENGVISS